MTTREDWLQKAIDGLRPRFAAAGYALPDVTYVSVGLPSKRALSLKSRRIGECWSGKASLDGNAHVFVSPLLGDAEDVLDVLTHELVHVVTPGAGHKAGFVKAANAVGLTESQPTSRSAGQELKEFLKRLNAELGEYPHAALLASQFGTKQSTRLLKVECSECGYTCRVTAKWLMAGAPICPVHEIPMEEA